MHAAQLPSPDLGLEWRPISLDDVGLWQDLVHAIGTCDESTENFDHDDLVEELTGGSYKDPSRHSLIGIDGDGVARAFGHLTPLPGTTLRRIFLWGGVHPDWRRRGIGREVLRWQTERAFEVLADGEASNPSTIGVPWRIAVNHAERLSDRDALCAAAGYTAIRWFHEMFRPLGADAPPIPDVAVPDELEMAGWTEDRDDDVRLAHNEAFAAHWGTQPRDEAMWKQFTTEHRSFRREWSRLVLDPSQRDGRGLAAVAAYVFSHAFEHDWETLGYSQARVGLIGVRPGWRGRGLAPALLSEVMGVYAAAGLQSVGLDVDTGNSTAALRVYEGVGFTVKETSVTWAIEGSDLEQ